MSANGRFWTMFSLPIWWRVSLRQSAARPKFAMTMAGIAGSSRYATAHWTCHP